MYFQCLNPVRSLGRQTVNLTAALAHQNPKTIVYLAGVLFCRTTLLRRQPLASTAPLDSSAPWRPNLLPSLLLSLNSRSFMYDFFWTSPRPVSSTIAYALVVRVWPWLLCSSLGNIILCFKMLCSSSGWVCLRHEKKRIDVNLVWQEAPSIL